MKEEEEDEVASSSRVATEENINTMKKNKNNQDRLSNLPDELIHRILSLLDAKLALQTSVLSKRWRYLWTSLPVVNFDVSFFDDLDRFESFVDHVLSRRDTSSTLHMLKFACDCEMYELYDVFIIDSIIDHAVRIGIQDLSFYSYSLARKIPQLYPCQSLTTLTLKGIEIETTTFDFVFLKNLYFFCCRFHCGDQEFLDPFRGCANLRCLYLHECDYYDEILGLKIYAPQLTELSIAFVAVDDVFDPDCVIELFTPKLQSFSYNDFALYDLSFEASLPFLEKVDIDVGGFELSNSWIRPSMSYRLIELFEVMGSAKFVCFSPNIIKVLSKIPALLDGRPSPFTRMQTFEIRRYGSSSSIAIPMDVIAYLFGFDCY